MPESPQHVAIIMDGNGRWARSRGMPRVAGHRASVKVVRKVVEECAERKVRYLTLFAFSSENWLRPAEEVGVLMVAVAYGGRWDIAQACRSLAADVAAGKLLASEISEEHIGARLALAGIPDPDLLIRTGGEQRISNFLLWNLAYTEFYFTAALWPEFSPAQLQTAFDYFGERERRFGKTSAQVAAKADA